MSASEPRGPLRLKVPVAGTGRVSRPVQACPGAGVPALSQAGSRLVWFLPALALALLPLAARAQEDDAEERSLEDFAEVYTDRYFEPDPGLELAEPGKLRSDSLAHYSRALSLEASGQEAEALAAFREVLRLNPGQVSLARKVAYQLGQSGDVEEGQALLAEARRNNPRAPQALIFLSEYLATFYAADEVSRARAMQYAEEAAERFPSHPASWEHLVRMHLLARKPAEARAALLRASEREEENPLYWIRIGRVAQRIWPLNPETQSPDEINAMFEKALARGDGDPRVRERVGDYYHDSGQHEKARDVYLDLVADYPDQLQMREKLARVYGALGNEGDVIVTLEGIVEINPQDAETHRELGRIHVGREDYEKASRHFREAMRLTSGTAEEYDAIGRLIIFGARMAEDAVTFLERGAYLHPADARLPFLLTFALVQMERYEDAIVWFEKTAELAAQNQPDLLDAVFHYRYAACVERAGDVERATALFRASMELLAKMDQDDERVGSLRAEIYNYLGYMWLENDMNIDEAGELIKEAVALSPDSGAITDSLGWFYFKKGRYEDAKRELLKASELVENPDAVIYDHLAQAYHALGDRESALAAMGKALELEPENEEFQERLKQFQAAPPGEESGDKEGAAPAPPGEE